MAKLVLFFLILSISISNLLGASKLDSRILNFEIDGLRLRMSLETAQKTNQFKMVKPIKDSNGVISGYEVNIVKKNKRVSIYFTSEKRLYNIRYYNRYLRYEQRGIELLDQIKRKYGPTSNTGGSEEKIVACWGRPCIGISPKSPYLRAIVIPASGRIELNLYHKGILLEDWEFYRRKTKDAKSRLRNKGLNNDDSKLDF